LTSDVDETLKQHQTKNQTSLALQIPNNIYIITYFVSANAYFQFNSTMLSFYFLYAISTRRKKVKENLLLKYYPIFYIKNQVNGISISTSREQR
jgi:hypothetical protein